MKRYLLWHPESDCLYQTNSIDRGIGEDGLVEDVTNDPEWEYRYGLQCLGIDWQRPGEDDKPLTAKELEVLQFELGCMQPPRYFYRDVDDVDYDEETKRPSLIDLGYDGDGI